MTETMFRLIADLNASTVIPTYYILMAILAIVVKLALFQKPKFQDTRLPEITCSNPFCRYTGTGLKTEGSNYWLFVLLLFTLGILVAAMYLATCGRPGIICPKCGERIPRKKCRYELISV